MVQKGLDPNSICLKKRFRPRFSVVEQEFYGLNSRDRPLDTDA